MFKPKVEGNQVHKRRLGSRHALYRVQLKNTLKKRSQCSVVLNCKSWEQIKMQKKQVDVLDRREDFQTGCFKWDTNDVTLTMWFHLDLNLNPFYLPHLFLMPTSWLKVSERHLQAKETLGLNWNVLLSDFRFLFPLLWRISTSTQIAWLAIVKIKAWLGFASNATRTSRQFLNSDSEFPYMLHHASHRWLLWAFSCWDASKR